MLKALQVGYIDDKTFEKRLPRYEDTNLEVAGLTPSNLAYVMYAPFSSLIAIAVTNQIRLSGSLLAVPESPRVS